MLSSLSKFTLIFFIVALFSSGCSNTSYWKKNYQLGGTLEEQAAQRELLEADVGKDAEEIARSKKLADQYKNGVSNADVLFFMNNVKRSLRDRMHFSRIARLASSTAQVLTAAAAATLGVTTGSLTAITTLAASSALMPQLMEIFNAKERAEAYSQGLHWIEKAEADYRKKMVRASITKRNSKRMTIEGAKLYARILGAIKLVERALVRQIPSIDEMKAAAGRFDEVELSRSELTMAKDATAEIYILKGGPILDVISSDTNVVIGTKDKEDHNKFTVTAKDQNDKRADITVITSRRDKITLPVTIGNPPEDKSSEASAKKPLRIVVVGDTGMGENGFKAGYDAIMNDIKNLKPKPKVLLHLGDFVYSSQNCTKFESEIKKNLIHGFEDTDFIFAMGDNDNIKGYDKDKNEILDKSCLEAIASLDGQFDGKSQSEALEGTRRFDNVLIAVQNTNDKKANPDWIKSQIKEKDWVIFAQHEPALSIAWGPVNQERAKKINSLKPDLVFAGHHHAYQRFCPTESDFATLDKLMSTDWKGKCKNIEKNALSKKGEGTIHIVTGGGGAKLRPFAKNQNEGKEPQSQVDAALANSAIMNHFVLLDIYENKIKGEVHAVCAEGESRDRKDEKESGKEAENIKSNEDMWTDKTILECSKKENKDKKRFIFEKFEIRK
jgi:hypothetical protein